MLILNALYRVKDYNENLVGFIVDNSFYTDSYIRKNIDYIDNLSVLKNGVIRAKKKLKEVYYKDVVNIERYNRICKDNPFKRTIQDALLEWKKAKNHKVLQLWGSRQIGKTTELLKFAYKNYDYVVYVDLVSNSFNFKNVIDNGCTAIELSKYCDRAFLPKFVDDKNTVLIIDEIQSSSLVYNNIRLLSGNLNCDIIVTGSYLGRILQDKEFFLPAGTVETLYMTTLSFFEFCDIFNQSKLLSNIDLYGNSDSSDYNKLNQLYELYLQIGGYPEVVKTYIETNNISICYDVIEKLLEVFKEESRVYMKNIRETEIFSNVYREALKEMVTKKVNTKSALGTLTTLVTNNVKHLVSKSEVADAVLWLRYSGIILMCNLALNGDMRNIQVDKRMYFSDCGIMSYLAKTSALVTSNLIGLLTETFVYNELHRLFLVKQSQKKVLEDEVCFSMYGNYELDFVLKDLRGFKYGIEVKTTKGNPLSLKFYVQNHLVDKGFVVKPTKGGIAQDYSTIPIYTVGCRFPYN